MRISIKSKITFLILLAATAFTAAQTAIIGGASFGDGNLQTKTYPSYSYVDYVRVWKSK